MNERELVLHFLKRLPLIMALACLLLAVFVTFPKLEKMFLITGVLPGAILEKQLVVNKRQTQSRGLDYWEITTDSGISERINYQAWSKLSFGDPIEFMRLPNDSELYAREGIFVELGNFIFDFVLLFLEVFGFIFFMYRFFVSRRANTTSSI